VAARGIPRFAILPARIIAVPRTRLERIIAASALAVTASLVALSIPAWLDYRQSQRLGREPDHVAATVPPSGPKRGTTQTASMVKRNGLVWGGQTFENRARLAKWLSAHGSSIQRFTKKHADAVRGLPTQAHERTPASSLSRSGERMDGPRLLFMRRTSCGCGRRTSACRRCHSVATASVNPPSTRPLTTEKAPHSSLFT